MKPCLIFLIALISFSGASAQKTPDMLEKVIASVVTVAVYKTDDTKQALGFRGVADQAYEKILDLSNTKTTGSGFVIERNGKKYVVTNAHVVENASNESDALYVFSVNRTKYQMKIVGGDSFYDLAVLEFITTPGSEFEVVDFRTEEARVGEQVFAVGNPLGEYPYTVTDGIVSAKNRVRGGITGKFGFIQSTATVIWGNSGGPLVDANGKVLGINSQIAFAQQGSTQIWQPQINFALEAGISTRLINDILNNKGMVKRAWIGVEVVQQHDYDSYLAMYGMPWVQRDSLAVIKNLVPNSPAEKVLKGKLGAMILSVNGVEVRNVQEVLGEFEKTSPGSLLKMKITLNGATEEVSIKTTELTTQNLEELAKFVVKEHHGGLLTTDGEAVILKVEKQVEDGQPDPPNHEKRKGRQEEDPDKKKREENLRYRGAMREADLDEGTEFKVVAAGIESTNFSSIWRVNKLSDLGAAFRLSGLAGVFNIYLADPYGGDPSAVQINPSGSEQIYQVTLWY